MLRSVKFFYCYTVYGDKFLQMLHELNLQLDGSVAEIHQAVLVILTLISAVADWISTILPNMCGLSANLECISEYRTQKNRHLGTIIQLCAAISSQLRHLSTIGKIVTQQYLLHTCPHNMVNFSPLTAEICWRVWASQQISTGFASWFRYCTNVGQRSSTKVCRIFGRLLDW